MHFRGHFMYTQQKNAADFWSAAFSTSPRIVSLSDGGAHDSVGEVRDLAGYRIVLHQMFAELFRLGDHQVDGFIDAAGREIQGPDDVVLVGGDGQFSAVAVHRQQLELPSLPAVDQAD